MEIYTLPQLGIGCCGIIINIEKSAISDRLIDLGFIPGTEISHLYSAPAGDPKAYKIRGSVFALRDRDACAVKIMRKRRCV